MKKQLSQLKEGDFWILFLLATMWCTLFGIFYYFVPNIFILVIGALCSVVSIGGYIAVGGIRGLNQEWVVPSNAVDGAGWRAVRSAEERRAA